MTSLASVNMFLHPLRKNLLYITAHLMSRYFDFSRPLPSKKIPATPKLTVSDNRRCYIWSMPTSRYTLSMLA